MAEGGVAQNKMSNVVLERIEEVKQPLDLPTAEELSRGGMMYERVKRMWVARLRAEGNQQCTGFFKKGDRFCVLGLLCQLYIEDTGEASWEGSYLTLFDSSVSKWYGGSAVPSQVAKWAGFPRHRANWGDGIGESLRFRHEGRDYYLATLNDEVELTFDQLADLIDEQA